MTGLTALNFNDFDKLFVGFDRLHNELTRRNETSPLTNYPRYNLVAIGEDAYRIEMALPGWKKENIEIKQHKNKLTVESNEKQELDSDEERYIHKGLSGKTFSRIFTLGDWVEVSDAGFKNGLLVINLQVNTPDAEKPKTINIG
jgi:molecular chaperone IbpA